MKHDGLRSLALAVVALIALPAMAGSGKQDIYVDDSLRDADWHQGWADAGVAGDLVFASGIVVGPKPHAPDVEAAFGRGFTRLAAVLEKAGASLDDVVELTIYLTDIDAQLPALTRARLRHMRPPYAASTVVQVERLIPPDGIAEMRAVARLRPGRDRVLTSPPPHPSGAVADD